MADVQELDSWYFKFKHLLFSGFEANLQLNSKNGKASVTLTAELGAISVCKAIKKQRSPSYYNRLQKRKEERQNATNEVQTVVVAAEKQVTDSTVETTTDAEKASSGANIVDTTLASEEAEKASNLATKTADKVDILGAKEAAADKAEALAVQADEEKREKDIAEEQDMTGKRWQCVVHDCVVEYGDDLACTCCDACQGYVYGSDDDEDDDLGDPP